MGYCSTLSGALKIKPDLPPNGLALLQHLLANAGTIGPQKMSMTFAIDPWTFDQLIWDGSEKNCCLFANFRWLIAEMRKKFPHFSLEGTVEKVGEDGERAIYRFANGDVSVINPEDLAKVRLEALKLLLTQHFSHSCVPNDVYKVIMEQAFTDVAEMPIELSLTDLKD